jgi:hypothetical protein
MNDDDPKPRDLSTLSVASLQKEAESSEWLANECRKKAVTSDDPRWAQWALYDAARAAEYRDEINRRRGQGSTTVNHRNP